MNCNGDQKAGVGCGECRQCCEYLQRLCSRHAAEINRRRGAMSVAREALKGLGETDGTIYQGIKQLGRYKRAVESMAAQIKHPKTTGEDIVTTQLGE